MNLSLLLSHATPYWKSLARARGSVLCEVAVTCGKAARAAFTGPCGHSHHPPSCAHRVGRPGHYALRAQNHRTGLRGAKARHQTLWERSVTT